MANYFVDSTTGNDADNGTTMDLAWATVEHAEEAGALAAGDIVWVRRVHSELPASDIVAGYDGTAASPIRMIGCPRTTVAIASSDWTNGSTSVNIDDGGMSLLAHGARFITAPDGNDYFITNVTGVNTIILMNEYAGSTVNNQAATIKADEDYDLFNAIDDSAWVIKKANWNADSHALPSIDFNDGAFQWLISGAQYRIYKNIYVKDSSDSSGIIYVSYLTAANRSIIIKKFIIQQSANNSKIFNVNDTLDLKESLIIGSGAGASQRGLEISSYALVNLEYVAIYNCGSRGIYYTPALGLWQNVNVGVEQANGDDDIYLSDKGSVIVRNLRLGGTNGYVDAAAVYSRRTFLYVENYLTALEHRTFYGGGYWMKQSMPDGVDVDKKLSDYAIKIVPNVSSAVLSGITEWYPIVFEAIISANTDSKTYKVWVYNRAMGTLNDITSKDNIFMRVEYIKAYDDSSEYVIGYSESTQIDIANAASSSDWDYLEVAAVAPATTNKIRMTIYLNAYHATGMIYIDPQVVIS